jgi:hypothetical protein
LTAVDLTVANAWLIFTAPATLWTETAPVAAFIREHEQSLPVTERVAQPRFLRGSYFNWHAPSFARQNSSERMEQIARWDHDTLSHKYFLNSNLALVESYGSLKLVDYESLLLQARITVGGTSIPAGGLLRLTGCEYLVLPAAAEVPFAEKLPESKIELPENVSVWRMKRTVPRASIVHHVEKMAPLANPLDIAAVDARSRAVLFEPRDGKLVFRDVRRVAVVETNDSLTPELTQPDAAAGGANSQATIVFDSTQRIQVKASLDQPGLLVVADSWGPGWVAFVSPASANETSFADRKPLTIHRTNRCFRGVELPAGEWLVDFEYRPQSFYRGAAVSGLAWIALVMALVAGSFRRRV